MKSRQLPDGLCEACFKESGGAVPCPQCGYDPRRPIEDWSKLPPGFTLENRFVVGRALGQGGFGITYLAYDSSLSFRVALKEYFPRGLSTRHHTACSVLCSQPDEKENFEYGKKKFIEEARSAAQFDNHPNIAIVRDFFETNGTAYIVMNYYEGTDFMHYLKTFGNKVSFPEAMRYLSPVMKALDDIHARGIVHRDVSPDNIFITSDGGVRLLDFGAAKSVFAARVSHSVPIGKEGYCPPEQMTGKEIGPWTDVYGMAATLYRTLTGEVPASLGERWENENALPPPSARGARVSKDVDAAILRGLSLKRQDRWQSMFAFEEALKGPDSPGPTQTLQTPPPVIQPQSSPPQKTPRQSWAVVILGLLVIAAGVGYFIYEKKDLLFAATISQPAAQAAPQTTPEPASQTASAPAPMAASEPAAQTAPAPTPQPAPAPEKPASNPARKPARFFKDIYTEKKFGPLLKTPIKVPGTAFSLFAYKEEKDGSTIALFSGSIGDRTRQALVKKGLDKATSDRVDSNKFIYRYMPDGKKYQKLHDGYYAANNELLFDESAGNATLEIKSDQISGKGYAKIPGKALKPEPVSPAAKQGWLGISVGDLTKEIADAHDIKEKSGIIVADVSSGSAAERAGLQLGDVIISVNNEVVKDVQWFLNKVRSQSPGATLRLEAIRSGKSTTVTAKLDEIPYNVELYRKGEERYKAKDYKGALPYFLQVAGAGYAPAQYFLGYMYVNGYGVNKDYAEAVSWFRKAAAQGVAYAQTNLGIMYENGYGVNKDYAEAVSWFRKAADQGDAIAQFYLGYMYRNGEGVNKDYAEAVSWYRKAADQGHASAQYFLGEMYEIGDGVNKDYAEAVSWYRKAAAQGDADAKKALERLEK